MHSLLTSKPTCRSLQNCWSNIHSRLKSLFAASSQNDCHINPGPAEPRNISATQTKMLYIAWKYLDALADLLMTISQSYFTGPATKFVHDPKQLYFEKKTIFLASFRQETGKGNCHITFTNMSSYGTLT